MQLYDTHSKAKSVTTVVAVVVLIGMVVLIDFIEHEQKSDALAIGSSHSANSSQTALPNSGSAKATPSNTLNQSGSSSGYKDGTYTAQVEYYVPHGSESISVTLTVAKGVVTDSSIRNSENDYDSARYQEGFASRYKTYVVGKNLANVNVSYVAGASDTSQGFNDAVAQIQNEAKA